jgi:2-polyprenyl-3-methyl-5-hydroxy-6-metoxy-1,4-benzoquinol methylase
MQIKSPVTGSYNTSVVREISVPRIIALYNEELRLDVSRYFHGLETVQLCRCEDSGYRFYYPVDVFGDDAFYQHLQNFENYYNLEKWEYNAVCALIPESADVLEIGSGGGHFLQLAARKVKNVRLRGIELNTKAVTEARAKGLDVTAETIEEFAKENTERFDVVCSMQVLEHITEVRSFIESSLQTLKKGGRMIVCVPNNNPYLYKHDFYHTLNLPPHHAGLWNREAFSSLPRFFPMKVRSIRIEPLRDYKLWYQTQVNYYKEKGSGLSTLLSLIPRPVYKAPLILLKNYIEGRNILVEFVKQ